MFRANAPPSCASFAETLVKIARAGDVDAFFAFVGSSVVTAVAPCWRARVGAGRDEGEGRADARAGRENRLEEGGGRCGRRRGWRWRRWSSLRASPWASPRREDPPLRVRTSLGGYRLGEIRSPMRICYHRGVTARRRRLWISGRRGRCLDHSTVRGVRTFERRLDGECRFPSNSRRLCSKGS